MLRVRPFRAWRYARETTDISTVTAPPYDVISPEERARLLARDPENVVALELPEGSSDPSDPANRYARAARLWRMWRRTGVLARDPSPAFYVLEQRYAVRGVEQRRRALIAAVGLEPLDSGVVLPHETTLPRALGDRYELVRATAANFSQVLGLVDDSSGTIGTGLEDAVAEVPLQTATDGDAVESSLWAVTDEGLLASVSSALEPARIFIADGHHRYTTALAYRDQRRAEDAQADDTDNAEYEYVMMALVPLDDPGLLVLPTHRIADSPGVFDVDAFWNALSTFVVEEISSPHPAAALDALSGPGFVVRAGGADRPRLVRLRDDVDLTALVGGGRSDAWKQLDVAVLQELVLWPILGIHPDEPETLERLRFVKDSAAALELGDEHDVVFVLRPTTLDQMRAVAVGGETMPQKSTYFYPKLLSGLVLRSLD
jgi:uncharacterized protein (DUF1015 family)